MRVLVLGRDRTTSEGIAAGLAAHDDFDSAGTARSADEVLERLALPGARVDVVVADATLEDDDALHLARAFRGDGSAPRLVVTGLPEMDAAIVRYVEAGVDAYLTQELSIGGLMLVLRLLDRGEVLLAPPTAHRLIERIHALADLLSGTGLDVSGISELTPREEEVLDLLGERLTNREIGERLYISVGTVKSHVHSILGKLGTASREEARKLLILSRTQSA